MPADIALDRVARTNLEMKTQIARQRESLFDEDPTPHEEKQQLQPRRSFEDTSKNVHHQSNEQLGVAQESGASRCFALEQAYVHDVYAEIARECGACSPVRSHIKEFIFEELEYGSLLVDLGCGDGKYLNLNSGVFTVGMERCADWFNKDSRVQSAQHFRGDYLVGDVLQIPVRDEFFDGALCCGVLHHISTMERRIHALREIARLLKVGGKILITVWAFEGRELGSQDVLIKWNSSKAKERTKSRQSGSSYSESDDDSCTTSSCSTANYVNRRAAYESCNSPTAEFGTCYSFVRRALQKFNLAPANFAYHSSRRASRSSIKEQYTSPAFVTLDEDVPIELRNIDESAPAMSTSQPPSNNHLNAKRGSLLSNTSCESPQRNRSDSIKEHYSSLMSLIKDKLSTIKDGTKGGKPFRSSRGNGLLQHRFSLPTVPSFRRSSIMERFTPHMSVMREASLEKMDSFDVDKYDLGESVTEETDQLGELGPKKAIKLDKDTYLIKKYNSAKRRDSWSKVLQKSLSSDSLSSSKASKVSLSKQQSSNTESTTTGTGTTLSTTSTSENSNKLVMYYSMPELRSLAKWSSEDEETANNRCRPPRPTITELHPITFLDEKLQQKPEVKRDDSQDTQAAIDEIESSLLSLETRHHELQINYSPSPYFTPSPYTPGAPRLPTRGMKAKLQLDLPATRQSILLTAQEREDAKKTQRSLSVEYKAKVTSPTIPPPRRRFSASPSLYVPRTFIQFIQQEQQHETHPSVDSEESFITIIPANRSYRGSVDLANENDDSYIDDVMLDLDEEESEVVSSGDDALCENLGANVQQASGENTSASSTKSLASVISSKTPTVSQASTPSPPANLHRFFHLFRGGELEELIDAHVENLHVIRSYFSEHATSWCVVAEKVQVWTI